MVVSVETAVIGAIGFGAVAWAVRGIYRSVRKVGGCSSCASSGQCPLVEMEADPSLLAHGCSDVSGQNSGGCGSGQS